MNTLLYASLVIGAPMAAVYASAYMADKALATRAAKQAEKRDNR